MKQYFLSPLIAVWLLLGLCGPLYGQFVDTLWVTLQVNMKNHIVMYGMPPAVTVSGNFQQQAGVANGYAWSDWTPGQVFLTDVNADSIYETTFRLSEGTYSYTFLAGTAWGYDELIPATCGFPFNRREMVIAGEANDSQTFISCFGECTTCTPLGTQRNVTFRVYAANSTSSAFIKGATAFPFSTQTPMQSVAGSPNLWEASFLLYTGRSYVYKFVDGNGIFEDGSTFCADGCGACDFGQNRLLTLPAAMNDTTLPASAWSSCTIPQIVSVTFQVDMNQQVVSPNGVHIAGDFQAEAGYPMDWDPSTTQMTDANADGVYEITVTIPTGTYQYVFVNGNTWMEEEAMLPSACTVTAFMNRIVTVSGNTTLPLICFNLCTSCDMQGSSDPAVASLHLHPNPTTGLLHLHSDRAQSGEILDATGRVVARIHTLQGDNTLDISYLPTGVYLLRLEGGEAVRVVKE